MVDSVENYYCDLGVKGLNHPYNYQCFAMRRKTHLKFYLT